MIIVLDSNVLIADFLMSGAEHSAFWKVVGLTPSRVCVPSLVVAEVQRRHDDVVRESARSMRAAIRSSRGIISKNHPGYIAEAEVDVLCNEYRSRMMQHMSENRVIVADYPNVTHEAIVERILEKRHPFVRDDEGYRDLLLWEIVLETAINSGEVVSFVSNDRTAYGGKDDSLHDDLVHDINIRGISGKVHWYTSLKHFLNTALPLLVPSEFPTEQQEVAISKSVSLFLNDDLPGFEVSPSRIGMSVEAEGVFISGIGDVYVQSVESAFLVDQRTVLAGCNCEVEVYADYLLASEESSRLAGAELLSISQSFFDGYVEGAYVGSVTMQIQIHFDIVENRVIAVTYETTELL